MEKLLSSLLFISLFKVPPFSYKTLLYRKLQKRYHIQLQKTFPFMKFLGLFQNFEQYPYLLLVLLDSIESLLSKH